MCGAPRGSADFCANHLARHRRAEPPRSRGLARPRRAETLSGAGPKAAGDGEAGGAAFSAGRGDPGQRRPVVLRGAGRCPPRVRSGLCGAARPGLLSPLVSVPTSPNAPLRHAGLPVARDISHRGFLIGDITGQQRRRKAFKISRYLGRKGMGAGPSGTRPRAEDVRGLLRAGKRRRWHRPLYSTIVQQQGQNKARYRKTRTEGICSSRLGVFLKREASFYPGSRWPGGRQQTWANRRKWRTGSTSEKESPNCLHCPGFVPIVGTAILLTARRWARHRGYSLQFLNV